MTYRKKGVKIIKEYAFGIIAPIFKWKADIPEAVISEEKMIFDLQKASMMKRISAFLFDFIMRVILVLGIAWILSALFQYDAKVERFDELTAEYMNSYGVTLTEDEYNLLSDEEKSAYLELYKEANDAYNADPEVIIQLTPLSGIGTEARKLRISSRLSKRNQENLPVRVQFSQDRLPFLRSTPTAIPKT